MLSSSAMLYWNYLYCSQHDISSPNQISNVLKSCFLYFQNSVGRVEAATCPNQDPLHATTGLVPLLGIDVWEHAYYVDYRNVRPNYVNAIWDIIDWKKVEERLVAAAAKK